MLKVELDSVGVGQAYDFTFAPLTLNSDDVCFLGNVNADAILSYSLQITVGDGYLHYSTLEVAAEPQNSPVPKTSSLATWGIIGGVFGAGLVVPSHDEDSFLTFAPSSASMTTNVVTTEWKAV